MAPDPAALPHPRPWYARAFGPARGCAYCGDSPVNHWIHYLDTGAGLAFAKDAPAVPNPLPRFLDFRRSPFIGVVERGLMALLGVLGFVRFSDDLERATSARTKSVWKEARARGIRMQEALVFGLHRDLMRAMLPARPGGPLRWRYFQSVPIPPWTLQDGDRWVDDKSRFKAAFEAAGLPVARGRSVRTLDGALRAFRALAAPVIVKPREGSRARHTTVGIRDENELARAFARATELCPAAIVEEHVDGRIYRATCVDGSVIGIMELARPSVVADGRMTADELRKHHNAANKRFDSLTDVPDDTLFRTTIAHQGFAPDDVPPAGTELLLAEYSERAYGGYFVDVTDAVPERTIQEIGRAAGACRVGIVGFDLISRDLSDPNERFVFLEGNTLPFLEIHDIPYAGEPRSVSAAVWDLWGPLPRA